MNQTTKKWERQDIYGGKLVEILYRQWPGGCLAESLLKLDQMGYKIAMHIHDEVVLEIT